MTTTKMTRAELYELVWRTPMSRLAGEFGVTDSALAKTCRRLAVPRPGRGYWAKLAAKKKAKRVPLGKLPVGAKEWAFLKRTDNPVSRSPKPEPPEVPVPPDLRNAHEAVKRLGAILAEAERDKNDRLFVPGQREPIIAVTVATHRRALLILAALAKTLTGRGHAIVFEGTEAAYSLSVVVAAGVAIQLSIIERVGRKEHQLTPEEKRRVDDGDSYGVPKYDYVPCGQLQVVLHDIRAPRCSWSDTKTRSLDVQMGSVVLAIEAERERRQQLRLAEEERRQQEEQRRTKEAEERERQRLREARARRQDHLGAELRRMARAWSDAEEIRRFVAAVRNAVPEGERDPRTVEWLQWADKYVVSVNPLSRPHEIAQLVDPIEKPTGQVWCTTTRARAFKQ